MRGAGCTYNDLVDRDLDAHVERTRHRPLPSGAVIRAGRRSSSSSCRRSSAPLVLLQFNGFTILLGLASLLVVADLSVHEAGDRLAAIRARARLLLGRAGRLVGARSGGSPRAPVAALSRRGAVDDRLRHDLRAAGQGGRRADRRALHGAALRPPLAHSASPASTWPPSSLFGFAFVLADAGLFAFAGLGAGLLHAIWLIVTLDPDDPRELPGALPRQQHDGLDRLRRPGRRCAAQVLAWERSSVAGDDLAAFDLADGDRTCRSAAGRGSADAARLTARLRRPPGGGSRHDRRRASTGLPAGDDGREVEEVGQPVAIFFRRRRSCRIRSRSSDSPASRCMRRITWLVVADEQRDGLVLADGEADAAGKSGDRSRHQIRPPVEGDKTICAVAARPRIGAHPGKKRAVPRNGPPDLGGPSSISV